MIMMGGDKKKLAQVIVARYSGGGEAERNAEEFEKRSAEPEDDSYESVMLEAASEVMSAVKAADVKALKSAMYAFFEACDAMPHKEGEHYDEAD